MLPVWLCICMANFALVYSSGSAPIIWIKGVDRALFSSGQLSLYGHRIGVFFNFVTCVRG